MHNAVFDMKKRALMIIISSAAIASFALICAWPSIYLHLMDGHFLKEGIKQFNAANSSVGLCAYLTVRGNQNKQNSENFIKLFDYSDSFYRYEEYYNGGYSHETAILTLSYSSGIYEEALTNIQLQPGFSNKIEFRYGSFEFRLNDTERIDCEQRGSVVFTDYELAGNAPYLHWINLVGWSDSTRTLAFVGFYHNIQRRTGFWTFSETHYPFKGWDALFEEELPYYDWK